VGHRRLHPPRRPLPRRPGHRRPAQPASGRCGRNAGAAPEPERRRGGMSVLPKDVAIATPPIANGHAPATRPSPITLGPLPAQTSGSMVVEASVGSAMEAIQANKLRSFLTMLGIIIGVGAVIVMVALGAGASAAV